MFRGIAGYLPKTCLIAAKSSIRAGLTQAQLAKEVGTTQSVIARLEDAAYRGHALRMIEHIAATLGRRVEIRLRPMGEHRPYAYAH